MKARFATGAALVVMLVIGVPAHAETGADERLRVVPPASTSAEVTPVRELHAPVLRVDAQRWGIIKRSEDLAGETWREASEEAERFTLKGDVFFEIDKFGLTSRAEDELHEILGELDGAAIAQVEVGGHTDTVGTDAHNAELSKQRAQTVAEFLREELDEVEVTADGYGSHRLLMAEEGSEAEVREARSRNRRVEITVSYRSED